MDHPTDKQVIEKLVSLEELDQSLVVVGVRSWLFLCFFAALFIAAIAWAFLGRLPITVSGKCLVFDPSNSYDLRGPETGTVKEVRFFGGEKVKQGDVIIVYENPGFELVAPTDGEILWVNLKRGSFADPKQVAVSFQGHGKVEDLRILGFLPLLAGQKVKPGMSVLVALENTSPEKYGMIRATVSDVFPYPVSAKEYYLQNVPSKELLEYLTEKEKDPILLTVAIPETNPNTPSRLEWTSDSGPPYPIFPGPVGRMQVIVKTVRPISYVFPQTD